METFARDGISFSYLDRGTGAPFVFQHGLGGDASQPDGLHEPARRLVCLECRAHGATVPLGDPESLTFATFAADVVALMDHLEIERALVGGVSMGAGVAARVAAEHPERVNGLVLVRPAWLDAPHPDNLHIMETVGALLERDGEQTGLSELEQDPDYQAIAAQSSAAATSLRGQFERRLARRRAAVLRRMPADFPLSGGLQWADIATPALVVATQGDPIHPFAIGEALAAQLPAAELYEVPSKDVDPTAHAGQIARLIAAFADKTQELQG
jgi:pimeloyl-ACP methyl ester carboxylesterase